jgi:hypothetical protein
MYSQIPEVLFGYKLHTDYAWGGNLPDSSSGHSPDLLDDKNNLWKAAKIDSSGKVHVGMFGDNCHKETGTLYSWATYDYAVADASKGDGVSGRLWAS